MKPHTQILVGLAAGVAVGGVARMQGSGWLDAAVVGVQPLGTIFIRLITMVVIPLVVASLFVGVASLGDIGRLGRIGGKTFAYFLGTTIVAAVIGLAAALVAHLGQGFAPGVRDALVNQAGPGGAPAVETAPTLMQTLISMVPQNPIAAAAQGDLLPLIIAVCIFAAAATVLPEARRRPLVEFCESVNALSMVVIRWFMRLAPVAVGVLIAGTVATSGAAFLEGLFRYVLVVVAAIGAHVLTTLALALRAGAGLPVVGFVRAVSDALLLAFSTASSSVALPVSMRAATERLGLRQDVVSFVIPAGVTLNKNGAAVYKAATAVFIAHLYGLLLGPAQLLAIVVTTVMASSAGAGVPGSSLVTTLIVLDAIGLGPHAAAGIALVVAVDRPLDMCRTTANTLGNLVGAAWISRSESGRAPLAGAATSPGDLPSISSPVGEEVAW